MARKALRFLDGALDACVTLLLLCCLLYGIYGLWDSAQVYQAASPERFALYKPEPGEEKQSLEALTAINPDVFGWITVTDTGIDHPLVQGEDNWEYLNKAADGSESLAGAIFLDTGNAADFSDYNSLIHGHHMAGGAMFGDVAEFADREFFEAHRTGTLHAGEKLWDITLFAYLLADAYDSEIYAAPMVSPEQQQAYLELLCREADVLLPGEYAGKNLILLSTCSSAMTNGRSILVGFITEKEVK